MLGGMLADVSIESSLGVRLHTSLGMGNSLTLRVQAPWPINRLLTSFGSMIAGLMIV